MNKRQSKKHYEKYQHMILGTVSGGMSFTHKKDLLLQKSNNCIITDPKNELKESIILDAVHTAK